MTEGAQGPRVQAAPHRLQRSDRLHRPLFRRARDAAARHGGLEQLAPIHPRTKLGPHGGFTMMHGAVGHHVRQFADVDATRLGQPGEIVALEVDDHGQLGLLLFTLVELDAQAQVVGRCGATRPCTLDGSGLHPSVGRGVEEEFGGAAHDAETIEVERRGKWVARAERVEHFEGVPFDLELEAASQIHLIQLATRDLLERCANARFVKRRRLRGGGPAEHGPTRHGPRRSAKPLGQPEHRTFLFALHP